MKKRVLLFFIISAIGFINISNVSSIEIILSKDNYFPGETLQAEITGNFIQLNKNNILIYENNIPRLTPVISDLIKYNDIYYFYAILPNKEGNFSLRIENAEYLDNGKPVSDSITKDFALSTLNESAISVNKGFIVADGEKISLNIKSLNGNLDTKAELQETNQTQLIHLIEGIDKKIEFNIKDVNKNRVDIIIDDYKIPVFLININDNPITNPEKIKNISVFPNVLEGKLKTNQDYLFEMIIWNSDFINISNITITNNLGFNINPDKIDFLKTNEKRLINLTVKTPAKKQNLTGNITIEYENRLKYINISFEIVEEQKESNITGTSATSSFSCKDIGIKCTITQSCEGRITSSLEGDCCVGTCLEIKEKKSIWPKIIGITLILILLIAGFFLYKKSKKNKNLTSEDILNEKSKKYKERMNQESSSEETRGKLTKV